MGWYIIAFFADIAVFLSFEILSYLGVYFATPDIKYTFLENIPKHQLTLEIITTENDITIRQNCTGLKKRATVFRIDSIKM